MIQESPGAEEERVFQVDASNQGTRIDRLLAARYPDITRSRFQKLCRDGHVTARGKKVRSAYRVLEGDTVRVRIPPPEPVDLTPEDLPLDVRFADEDVIVVDKPPGRVVHPAAGHRRGTLVHALLHRFPDLRGGEEASRPGIVHRLDKDTSGLMLVARNEFAHARLGEALRHRDIHRHYVTLVWGRVARPEGWIVAPVGRDAADRKKMTVTRRGGKPARTHYRVRERFAFATLLDVELETGRTHQIRVHMAWKGHPVFGDPAYGGRNSGLTALPAPLRVQARKALKCMSRQALHAARLTFRHPRTDREMVFESRLPDDFESTLAVMRQPAPGVRG